MLKKISIWYQEIRIDILHRSIHKMIYLLSRRAERRLDEAIKILGFLREVEARADERLKECSDLIGAEASTDEQPKEHIETRYN